MAIPPNSADVDKPVDEGRGQLRIRPSVCKRTSRADLLRCSDQSADRAYDARDRGQASIRMDRPAFAGRRSASKLHTRVRFPSPAPIFSRIYGWTGLRMSTAANDWL